MYLCFWPDTFLYIQLKKSEQTVFLRQDLCNKAPTAQLKIVLKVVIKWLENTGWSHDWGAFFILEWFKGQC